MRARLLPGFLAITLLASARVAAAEPATLPDALPPLDDRLVEGPPAPVRFFAQARLRGELDDARELSRQNAADAGVDLTGRIGVDAELDAAHLTVVLGDGGRVGPPPITPVLVAVPTVPFIYELALTFDVAVAGLPSSLSLGRMPVIVADGRLVGAEPFDARGRTLDGARALVHAGFVDVSGGAFWLGPDTSDASDTGSALSGLFVGEVALRPIDAVDVDVYGLLHRDGRDGLTIPTAGVRLLGSAFFLRGRAGGDVQAPVVDGGNALSPTGTAAHAEAGARATLPSFVAGAPDLFVDGSGEITAGAVVHGRVFRAPEPTQHDALGLMDLVAADNTWSAAVDVGAEDPRGLKLDLVGRLIGLVDEKGPLFDTGFAPIRERKPGAGGLALMELDAGIELPLNDQLALDVGYGIALPGTALVGDAPAQRLLITLRASALPFASAGDARARTRNLPPLE